MRDFEKFESSLLDKGETMRAALSGIFNNMGRIIALITAFITIVVTFTDISFASITPKSVLPSLLLLVSSSYIIYFSLENSGERLGEGTPEYKEALERFISYRDKVCGEDIDRLRRFLEGYCLGELEYRQRCALMSHGLSISELDEYKCGARFNKEKRITLRKIAKMKPVNLTPAGLLCRDSTSGRSELQNPERRKLSYLLLRLIPSTICMTITISVILNVKSGMTVTDVLNALLKLSSLPLVGFRGYSAGYTFTKNTLTAWYRTKADIIEAFLNAKAHGEIDNTPCDSLSDMIK